MADLELKPCPFCGGTAGFVTDSSGYNNDSRLIGFKIKCSKCGLVLPKKFNIQISLGGKGNIVTDLDQRQDAVNSWNNRKVK